MPTTDPPTTAPVTVEGASGALSGEQGPADAALATYTLRSDAPWLTAPGTLALRSASTTVQLRVARHGLAAPGASVGTVTGWGPDTLAGPAFRLVTTVIAAAPTASKASR